MNTYRPALKPMAPFTVFLSRLFRSGILAAVVIVVGLAIGSIGYHAFEGLPWIDATLNASMILSGMGPVDHIATTGGKIFATCYAIFSGVLFISTAAILLTPVVRRSLHRLHLDMHESGGG